MGRVEKTPQDARIRVRLLEAQQAEWKALRQVERSLAMRQRALRKQANVLFAEQRRVEDGEEAVVVAQAALVDVSGIDRAAQLLDLPVRTLRASVRQTRADREKSCPGGLDPGRSDQSCTTPEVGQS